MIFTLSGTIICELWNSYSLSVENFNRPRRNTVRSTSQLRYGLGNRWLEFLRNVDISKGTLNNEYSLNKIERIRSSDLPT